MGQGVRWFYFDLEMKEEEATFWRAQITQSQIILTQKLTACYKIVIKIHFRSSVKKTNKQKTNNKTFLLQVSPYSISPISPPSGCYPAFLSFCINESTKPMQCYMKVTYNLKNYNFTRWWRRKANGSKNSNGNEIGFGSVFQNFWQ